MSSLDTASTYIARGWAPVPVPYKEKGPKEPGWPALRLTAATAHQYFNGASPSNVGVILGAASEGLTDVDLDCVEAVALAPHVLPKTEAIFGRASRRSSHWLYQTNLAETTGKAAIQYRDNKEMLVEIRIGGEKGAQTVFPGSTHETGELVEWEMNGSPAKVDGTDLGGRVARLAACCLLTRYWPKVPGSRHETALIVGGFMSRAGVSAGTVAQLVEAIARAAGDSEPRDRRIAAKDAAEAHRKGQNAYGLTQMRETFGKPVAERVAEWLGYREAAAQTAANQQSAAPAANVNDAQPPAFTDEALALRFAEQHAGDLRYVDFRSGWMQYDGQRWKSDDTLLAYNCARKLCRVAAKDCNESGPAKTLASAKTSSAVEKLASTRNHKSLRRRPLTRRWWTFDLVHTNGSASSL